MPCCLTVGYVCGNADLKPRLIRRSGENVPAGSVILQIEGLRRMRKDCLGSIESHARDAWYDETDLQAYLGLPDIASDGKE